MIHSQLHEPEVFRSDLRSWEQTSSDADASRAPSCDHPTDMMTTAMGHPGSLVGLCGVARVGAGRCQDRGSGDGPVCVLVSIVTLTCAQCS